MHKKIMGLLLALAASVGLLAVASPASAAGVHSITEWDSISRPPSQLAQEVARNLPASSSATRRLVLADCDEENILCLWSGYSYTGTMWRIPKAWLINGGNGLSFEGSGINNASKGWFNRVNQTVTLMDDLHCLLDEWNRTLLQGQYAVSANAASNDWENRIGSVSLWTAQGVWCSNNYNI